MSYRNHIEALDSIRHLTPSMTEDTRYYVTIENGEVDMTLDAIEEIHPHMLSPREITTSCAGNPIVELQFEEVTA